MKLNIRELRDRAAGLTAQNREPLRKLLLIYCGVIAVLTLGVPALDLFLSDQIGTTGGLAGMRLRTVLQTIREILNLVNQFFGYFWSAGFVIAMMAMVLGREPQTRDLTGGFRRFFRVLGHIAFEFLFVVALLLAAGNLAAMLFSMSPQGGALVRELTAITSDPNLLTPEGLLNVDLIPMDLLAAIDRELKPLPNNIFLRSQIPKHRSLPGDQILGNEGDASGFIRVINEGIGHISSHHIDSTNSTAQIRRAVPIVMGAAGLNA